MDTNTLIEMFIWLWGGVVTFFCYKLLSISRQVNQIHDIYTKTDENGMYLGYSQDAKIIKVLDNHVESQRQEVARFHGRLGDIQLNLEKINSEVSRCCKYFADRPGP
jgi:hypothetical protein